MKDVETKYTAVPFRHFFQNSWRVFTNEYPLFSRKEISIRDKLVHFGVQVHLEFIAQINIFKITLKIEKQKKYVYTILVFLPMKKAIKSIM